MPRPSSSPTTCAATSRACRCGRTATRRVIARSKFVRRHAAAVAAGIVLLLAMVAGIVGTTTGLVLARRERDRAEASSRQARRAVDQFFTRVSEERLLNQPGLDPLRKTLLQDAQRFYEEFLDQHGGDPALRAELAAARARAARITGEIGSPAQAVPQFQQAVALWEEPGRGPARQPGLSGRAGPHPQRSGRGAHAAGGPARRGPPHLPPRRGPARALARRRSSARSRDVTSWAWSCRTSDRSSSSKASPTRRSRPSRRCWRSRRNWPPRTPRPSSRGSPWPRPMACWARS